MRRRFCAPGRDDRPWFRRWWGTPLRCTTGRNLFRCTSPRTWWGTSWASAALRATSRATRCGRLRKLRRSRRVFREVRERLLHRRRQRRRRRRHKGTEMEFRAEMRYLRVSPQKARLVLELIKGRKVEEARNTLLFTKKRVAAHIGKLLQSALDNANFLSAEKNLDVELDNLYVKSAIANDGPRMKRIRPAPQGRAFRYQRRISHITLILAERGNGAAHPSGQTRAKSAGAPAKRRAPVAKKAAGKTGKKKVAAK